jgi:hypothetical protein
MGLSQTLDLLPEISVCKKVGKGYENHSAFSFSRSLKLLHVFSVEIFQPFLLNFYVR